jgi:phosphate uptake regulator
MKRRIIKQGHNTLTITLPSDWTRKYNISAGQEIDLNEKENGLFLSTEKNFSGKKAEFDISGMDIPTIWKYFMAVYREGYDEILVRFKENVVFESPYKFLTQHRIDLRYKKEREKKTVLEALHALVTRFIGFEVVEHGKDYIIIKEMGSPSGKEFDNSLRRVFFLIQQMAEETLEAIKTNNPKILSHMHDVDINLDKFHDYCIRILNKTGNKDGKKTSLYFSTLYLLELLGDEFKNISTHLINDFPSMKMKNIQPLVESIKEQVDAFYDLFYKFDKEKIQKIAEIDSKTYLKVPETYKKASEEEKEIFHHLRIISRYINALLELKIEMEF